MTNELGERIPENYNFNLCGWVRVHRGDLIPIGMAFVVLAITLGLGLLIYSR
jgi:hypothetical protein